MLIPILLLAGACKNPVWYGDVESFVEDGLSNVCLKEAVFASDGSAIDYLTSTEETVIRLKMVNPQKLAVTYTLTADDGTLYDNDPESNLTISDYKTLVFPVDPTLAAEHHTLGFTLGIYVASLNRTYPDVRLEFSCETAPNPVQSLMGGKTYSDKAMIAFQIPQEDTDEDISTIEIVWGVVGSGTTVTSTFDIDDSSLTSPPSDGDNLLGAEASQNRYFYPSSAVTGSVYGFKVTLIDESGRRSETCSTASDLVEYSVTYDENAADSGSAPTTQVVEYGETAVIAYNTGALSRTGYTFGGWNTAADGTGTDYTPGQSVVMDSGNLILYAKWLNSAVTYVNTNGDVTTAPPSAVGYGSGDTVTVLGYDSLGYTGNIVDGHYLLGWDTSSSASTVVYEVGDTFTMGSAGVYLYAVWAECMGDASDLAGITDMSGDYYLENDIALTGTWTAYIGDSSDPFVGRFFGNGHTISGLAISSSGETYVGLFGYIGSGGEVYDLDVSGSVSSSGDSYVGLLAGCSEGTIENCSATGTITVTGTSGSEIGGLVGRNTGDIVDCTTDVDITSSVDRVGGITGYAAYDSTITGCTVNGDVTGASNVGGVAGWSYSADIDQCTVNGNVEGTDHVGGIVGQCYVGDEITNCVVNGTVTGTAGYIGGLIGLFNHYSGTVEGCTVYGAVSGDGNYVGGLIGYARGVPIDDCRVEGSVTCGDSSYVGGLVGYYFNYTTSASTISGCSVTRNLSVTGTSTEAYFGGLIGYNDNQSTGTLTIENCYVTGDVTAATNKTYTGGLVGYNINSGTGTSSLYRCFAAGDVTGNTIVGGLVGYNDGCSIIECYASGDVQANTVIGGLAAQNYDGAILDCYAAGDVSGDGTDYGGLIYTNTGSVTSCHFCGAVTDSSLAYNCLFVGNTQDASTCYYLSGSSTGGSSTAGYPLTAADLRDQSSYDSAWDFTGTWSIDASTAINNGYPYLTYFYVTYGVVYGP